MAAVAVVGAADAAVAVSGAVVEVAAAGAEGATSNRIGVTMKLHLVQAKFEPLVKLKRKKVESGEEHHFQLITPTSLQHAGNRSH